MDFDWAKQFPEVYKICTLFQLIEVSNPVKYSYKSLSGFLQDGPQCGLVALAICIGPPGAELIKNLYESAKLQNFTYNGEMFSADFLANLAKQHLPCNTNVEVYNGDLDDERIKEFLLDGGIILVPYDTNKDNSPGLHRGHKAHWATVSGGIETDEDFFVLARHGKARNVAVWKLSDLAKSNGQLLEFSPDRKLHDMEYKLPEGGICGPAGLNKRCVLIKL
ncbi:hypothetical protein NQ318_003955 [Aromia moschata]|uniref:Actin maturation protease n=1 Tax=Aromia moschata TaxID=1265417 RepID=A0AAV8ZA91_9CUCU|nr:hypothetical protein NQ318_003955 [Aromia moschata]